VSARTVRTRILDLQEAQVPIEREEDHPHVYYSVREGWFPGQGTGLDEVDHVMVARLLGRLPRSKARDALLSRLVRTAFGAPTAPATSPLDVDDRILDVIEDGAKRCVPVRMGYYSAGRGESGIRVVSVQRVLYGSPTRFVAYCHRSSTLKFFRADRVTSPEVASTATFLKAADADVDALLSGSLDGFAGRGPATPCAFVVRSAEAHWVQRNLPAGAVATAEPAVDGVRLSLQTTAVEILARYLTGLGAAVRDIEPTELRQRVRAIAKESLAATGARLNKNPARTIRSAV
jgi:predicted DNA-binding transcriptional regulator YafY